VNTDSSTGLEVLVPGASEYNTLRRMEVFKKKERRSQCVPLTTFLSGLYHEFQGKKDFQNSF